MKLMQTAGLVVVMALLLQVAPLPYFVAYAADVENRSMTLGTSTPSATTTHTFGFDYGSTDDVGSVMFEYCSNTPVVGIVCNPVPGLDVSGVSLDAQTNETGFSVDGGLTNTGRIVLTRAPQAVTPAVASTYEFSNAVNPSASNTTFYARITTYASVDATGPIIDSGGVALSTGLDVTVDAYVPPFLEFCVGVVIFANDCATASGNLIDLGAINDTSTATGISKFQAATNAPGGYSVVVTGKTLTSGNNTIPALSAATSSQIGVSQFGFNLRANSTPSVGLEPSGPGTASPAAKYGVVNNYAFSSGDQLVSSGTSNDRKTFTVSYIANADTDQKIGNYTTTLTYICTGSF